MTVGLLASAPARHCIRWRAGVVAHWRAGGLARVGKQITLLAVGVFRSERYPNLGPLPEGGGGGPTESKFL